MTCTDLHEQLDAHLDGDLPPEHSAALAGHTATCAECAAELALARRVHRELRELSPALCPEGVFEATLARVAVLERPRAPRAPVPGRARPRWRVAVGGVVLLGALALGALRFLSAPAEPTYSPEEIAEAHRQVELAFALVGRAGLDAGLYLQDAVMGERVVAPLQRHLGAP
jgi:anti-sigma factor RsiW